MIIPTSVRTALSYSLVAVTLLMAIAFQVVVAQRDAARADLRAEKVITADLSGKLLAQNEAIDRMAEQAKENREVYLAGLAAANRRAVRLEVKAEDILSLPSPTTKDEQCEAARALLLENI
jgi:hypothetical protein